MISITFVSGNTCLFAWNILQTLISLGIGLFSPMFKKKGDDNFLNFFYFFFFFYVECAEFSNEKSSQVEQWKEKTITRK